MGSGASTSKDPEDSRPGTEQSLCLPAKPRPSPIRCRARRSLALQNYGMSAKEIDEYLAQLDEPKRSTLQALRESIQRIIPEAEQCISYGAPAFRIDGKVVAGFAAFKNHLAYLPHSGSVFPELRDELAEYVTTSGSLHFPIDRPLPEALVRKLIEVRLPQVRQRA
jgi:uncharacterized protein YdhG (YjbR/CyaY superfamily)